MQLRGYQSELIDRVRAAIAGGSKRILIQMATGGGKTPVGSFMIAGAAQRGHETWMVAHKTFLVEQASDKLRKFEVRHGVISSGSIYNPRVHVQVCSLGVLRNRHQQMRPPRIIVWDEVHHIGARTWAELMAAYPHAIHIGLTATPVRPGGGGLGDYFDTLIVGPSVADLIQWGRDHPGEGLCGYRYFSARHTVSGDSLHTRMGEFIAEELGEVMDKPAIIGDLVGEFKEVAADRKFLTFSPTVAFSQHIAEKYRSEGINCAHLDGSTDKTTIKRALRDLEAGALQGISSVNLFLEGLDVTSVNCVQWARHTKSIVVKMQGDGRGMRNEVGKGNLLILDHVENWKRFGMPDDEQEWTLDPAKRAYTSDGASTTRECPYCFSRFSITKPACPECQKAYPVKARTLEEVDGKLFELDAEALRDTVKKEVSPERKAQQGARTREALVLTFLKQFRDKHGRDPDEEERMRQERRAGHVLAAREKKSGRVEGLPW